MDSSRYSNTSHLVQTYYDQQQRDAYAGSGERANLTQKDIYGKTTQDIHGSASDYSRLSSNYLLSQNSRTQYVDTSVQRSATYQDTQSAQSKFAYADSGQPATARTTPVPNSYQGLLYSTPQKMSVGDKSSLTASHNINGNGVVMMSSEANADVAKLRKMLATVSAELGKQITASQGESRGDDTARAEWLQKLVLQMEAKQALSESELRDYKAKYTSLHAQVQEQQAENDTLRENLSRATRGQAGSVTQASEEQAREFLELKHENQGYRMQIEDMNRRHDILERSVQHFESQQRNVVSENSNLSLRLQGAEQRTDQLMKQKAMMDEELHMLRAKLSAKQQELSLSEQQLAQQMQSFQQQTIQQQEQRQEEIKEVHVQMMQQQEQFEKQRSLMMQQRDGVQAGYESELNEAMDKLNAATARIQELEQDIVAINKLHAEDITERENAYVRGLKDAEDTHLKEIAEREAAYVKNLKEIEEKHANDALHRKTAYMQSIQNLEQKMQQMQENGYQLADSMRLTEDALERSEMGWGVAARKAVARRLTSRILTTWKEFSVHKCAKMQILHTALASTMCSWLRRALKSRLMSWKAETERAAALAELISQTGKARILQTFCEEWVRFVRKTTNENKLIDVEAKHAGALALLKTEMVAQTETLLLNKDQEHATTMAEASERLANVEKRHQTKVLELQEQMEEAKIGHESTISNMDTAHSQEINVIQQQHREEIIRLHQLIEEKRSEMDAEVAALKKQSDHLEATLRKEIVDENVRLNQVIQQTQDENTKAQREWRKKQLDKDRQHAAQIETLERFKLELEEELHDKIKAKEQEAERKIEKVRDDADSLVEELRRKGYSREKEFAAKLDASRAEYIRAQEEFQQEMLQKDEEFQQQLKLKAEEMNRHMESILQGKLNSHVLDLQETLKDKDEGIEKVRKEAALAHQLNLQQQATVDKLQNECKSLLASKENMVRQLAETKDEIESARELRSQLKKQADDSAAEVHALKRHIVRLEESLSNKDTEFSLLSKEREELTVELGQASQTLLKRGDDFAESLRLLQRRLELSDTESKALHQKLREEHAKNAQLSSELEQAQAMLQHHTARSKASEGDGNKVASLQEKLMLAQVELKHKEQQHVFALEQERALMQRTVNELQALKAQGPNIVMASGQVLSTTEIQSLQERVNELENYVQEVQPQIESTQRENDTLTTEMDKILAENAMIRNELDDLKDSIHLHNSRSGAYPGISPNAGRTHSAGVRYPKGYVSSANGHRREVGNSSVDDRPRRTSGLHGLRLLRCIFSSWSNLAVDMRSVGRNTSFSCLGYFCDADGFLAPWMPVGRIRKQELDIKSEKVGSGTFADVYRADVRIPCAIKRMKGRMSQNEIVEFIREGEMMRSLNHPNICKLLGVSTDQSQYALIFEYVPGVNLFDYLHKQRKTIPIGKQLGISVQICDAMAYVHECGVIHRDLKPQNVIYQEKTGVAKLCDFGLARIVPYNVREIDPAELGTGGTPAYQGPEVLKRQSVSMKLDLYGFAIMMWEMYTSRLPWSDCNLEQMTTRVAVQNERPLLPKDMPREYAEIVNRCWQREPYLRPDFIDILPIIRELHEAVSPGPKLSSASSAGSGSSGSTSSTVISHLPHGTAKGYQSGHHLALQTGTTPKNRVMTHSGASNVFGPF